MKMVFRVHVARNFATNVFVPKYKPVVDSEVQNLQTFLDSSSKILVVTGAGISTESGIPDYRSEEVGLYARSSHRPVQHSEFLKSAYIRQRYWARNYIGWPKFSSAQPGTTHFAVKELEDIGKVSKIVTQNVDGLHRKARSEAVIELHGTAFRVICLNCDKEFDRENIQKMLVGLNPNMLDTSQMIRPDGDVEILEDTIKGFRPPFCMSCGGALKPDITFFGDNVPRTRVEAVRDAVSESDAVLVLGSSLTVFSGYRIILQAMEEGKNVAIINIGPTRADHLAHLRIYTKCGDILSRVNKMAAQS